MRRGIENVPIDETVLVAMVEAAKLSTAQLERIAQAVLSVSLTEISLASTPAQQAKDLIAYAVQYQLEREVAAELLIVGAGKPALQNLLLGDADMPNQSDEQNNRNSSLDLVRLENRVGRLEDKFQDLAHRVEGLFQRAPLNWNIIIWGIVMATAAGVALWATTVVSR